MPLSFCRAEPQKIKKAQTDWLSVHTHIFIMLKLLNEWQALLEICDKFIICMGNQRISELCTSKNQKTIFFPRRLHAPVYHNKLKKGVYGKYGIIA